MKVELISYTQDALELLLYTKNTRLAGEASSIDDVKAWPDEKKLEHLSYMRDTIKSSWEFVDYVFRITGVTRAFTHQFVRTRHGSYAQESQRANDVSHHEWLSPNGMTDEQSHVFDESIASSINNYSLLLQSDMNIGDARGVLPTNLHTSIIAKFNLRTLHEMANVRLCTRTQGEYQNVFKAMKEAIISVHPWADDFIQVWCANYGTCCFPRFTDCPIQSHTYNSQSRKELHKIVIDRIRDEVERVEFEATFYRK